MRLRMSWLTILEFIFICAIICIIDVSLNEVCSKVFVLAFISTKVWLINFYGNC